MQSEDLELSKINQSNTKYLIRFPWTFWSKIYATKL